MIIFFKQLININNRMSRAKSSVKQLIRDSRTAGIVNRSNLVRAHSKNYKDKNQHLKNKIYGKAEQTKIEGVTSTNWYLYDSKNECMLGLRENEQRQVASLTKIMTLTVVLQIIGQYSLDTNLFVKVSKASAALKGSTANLKQFKYIKLNDLLYALMLPSGNDAAYLLAEVLGLLLFYQNIKPESKSYSDIESIDLTCYDNTTTFVNKFLAKMNQKAKELKLTTTFFANPHGLPNTLNVSSAKDAVTLSRYSCRNQAFMEIVGTEHYRGNFYDEDMETISSQIVWKNTNKLLGRGWEGLKTGKTTLAGNCLASKREGIFIVVLNCETDEARFQDTIIIYEWYLKQKENKNALVNNSNGNDQLAKQ